MTCVVIALAGERAHIFADSAHLGALGNLSHCAPKVRTFADRRFAFVVRGAVAHSLALRTLARGYRAHSAARWAGFSPLPAPLRSTSPGLRPAARQRRSFWCRIASMKASRLGR